MQRLFRTGDAADQDRHGKTTPERKDLPEPYQYLLDWYRRAYAPETRDDRFRGLNEKDWLRERALEG